ncbi:MAG: hypothetical protein ABIG85_07375 [Chloroflexota bacterium]
MHARTLALAAILALGFAAVVPGRCLACSCVAPPPLAELVQEPGQPLVIVVGRAGVPEGDRTPFGVERQYFGPAVPAVIQVIPATEWLPDGTTLVSSCGIDLAIGRRMFLVMSVQADGSMRPSVCLPNAPADEPAGASYIAEAEVAFGGGTVPVGPAASPPIAIVSPDTPAPAPPGGPDGRGAGAEPEPLVVGAGIVLVVGLALVLGLAIRARSRAAGGS